MNAMFRHSGTWDYLDVSRWDVGNVTDMMQMFIGVNVPSLDVSDWDVRNVRSINGIFFAMSGITHLDVSRWETNSLQDMHAAFNRMSIRHLDVSNWNTSNVINMSAVFAYSRNFESLDLTGWDTRNATTMYAMFRDTNNLRQLSLGSNFHFVTPPEPELQDTATSSPWRNVGTGTVSNPQGDFIFTSHELMTNFDGATMADTWVRQLHYVGSVTVHATNNPNAYINLITETVHNIPFTVAEFSINGGGRWRRGALPTGNAFSNLFNRGLTLWVRSEVGGGTEIHFPAINARPRANAERLRPWYSADTWALRARPARDNTLESPPAAPTSAYMWVQGYTANGRIPTDPQWQLMPTDHGFEILPPQERGVRIAFFFRSMPIAENGVYTPASRPFRIRPAALRRPLNLRINYASETLRTRADHEFSTDGGLSWLPAPTDTVTGRAVPFNVSDFVTAETEILLRRVATGRRTATVPQVIAPQPRARLIPLDGSGVPQQHLELPITNGRIDAQALRPYTALIGAAGAERWRAVPRATGNATFTVRLNPTARASRGIWSGYAASASGTLHIVWGVVGQDSRNRDIIGVTRAVITAYGAGLPPVPPTPTDVQFSVPPTTTPSALYFTP